jgi:hypothetical protein
VVRGGFFKDSLRVGDQTGFFLAAEYPTNLNILFPDSTFSFSPFEYESKKYFPTRTTAGRSYDSVIYYVSTFEVDPIQTLSLPVFQFNRMDCTVYQTPRDTILLTELVKDLPDTVTVKNLPLKVNVAVRGCSLYVQLCSRWNNRRRSAGHCTRCLVDIRQKNQKALQTQKNAKGPREIPRYLQSTDGFS